jgi:AraC family transcriptional regulator
MPVGGVIVNAVGHGGHYVWTGPHTSSMVSLAPAVVARAAVETRIIHPVRLDVRPTFNRTDAVITHLTQALAAESQLASHNLQALTVESIATALAIRIIAGFNAHTPSVRGAPGRLDAAALAKIDAYLRESTGPVSLEELASLVSMSRFHFARTFKRQTGESPVTYARRLRLERAMELITSTNVGLADVARQSGFADASHLTKTFRSFLGTTPTAFASARRSRRRPTSY